MAAALSLVGVVLAAVLTYVFDARKNRAASVRSDVILATTSFCKALMDYRGVQIDRWHREEAAVKSQQGAAEALDAARHRVRDARSAAWAAYFHVVLVLDDADAAKAARAALDATRALRRDKHANATTLDDAGDGVRDLAEVFVAAVAQSLHVDPASLTGIKARASD